MRNDEFENEYPLLLTIGLICKVIGIVIVIVAVIGFFYGISLINDYNSKTIGVILIFSSLLSGLLFSVPFFAFAELIKVFVRIEINTRKTNKERREEMMEESEKQRKIEKEQRKREQDEALEQRMRAQLEFEEQIKNWNSK